MRKRFRFNLILGVLKQSEKPMSASEIAISTRYLTAREVGNIIRYRDDNIIYKKKTGDVYLYEYRGI